MADDTADDTTLDDTTAERTMARATTAATTTTAGATTAGATTLLTPSTQSTIAAGQREVLGLLLVLGSLAYLAASAVTARAAARTEPGFSMDPMGGIEVAMDWDQFFRTLAFYATPQHIPLLVGGLLLASARPWQLAGPAARVARSALFPLGLVLAALSAYASYLAIAASSDGEEMGFILGFAGGGALEKTGTAIPYVITAAVALYVAWCAFGGLPFSQRPSAAIDDLSDDSSDGDPSDDDPTDDDPTDRTVTAP